MNSFFFNIKNPFIFISFFIVIFLIMIVFLIIIIIIIIAIIISIWSLFIEITKCISINLILISLILRNFFLFLSACRKWIKEWCWLIIFWFVFLLFNFLYLIWFFYHFIKIKFSWIFCYTVDVDLIELRFLRLRLFYFLDRFFRLWLFLSLELFNLSCFKNYDIIALLVWWNFMVCEYSLNNALPGLLPSVPKERTSLRAIVCYCGLI